MPLKPFTGWDITEWREHALQHGPEAGVASASSTNRGEGLPLDVAQALCL
ncbi:hypothetical protein [Corynebacterium simulans]|nr:hypothetical protein [Corynebacterium simulans]MCK6160905.1 hypothetical protein [Corynebacterium simulans]